MTASSEARTPPHIKPVVFLALITIQITFALNYLFSKLVMKTIPPLVWGNLRTLFTSLILITLLLIQKKLRPRLAWQYRRELFLFSLLGVVINQGTFLMGLKLTTAANSSLINTLIPVFTVLRVTLFGKERLKRIHWVGFFFAFIGILILQDWKLLNLKHSTAWGDGLTVINALSYSGFLFLSPPFFKSQPPLWTTTWLFICGAFALTLVSIPQWKLFHGYLLEIPNVFFIFGGVVFGTIIPYLLISYVLTQTSSALVAQFVYLQALVAGLLSYYFLNEPISFATFISAAFIFLGLYLTLAQKPFGIKW